MQESHSRLGQVLTTSAEATAKAVVRKAAAQAMQQAISEKQEETGDMGEHRVAYKDARDKEKKMGALISSLVALAHASGVAQERALFMEVASREVDSQMKKLSGGAASAVLPAVSELSQRAAQKIVLNIRNFSICTGTTGAQPRVLFCSDA